MRYSNHTTTETIYDNDKESLWADPRFALQGRVFLFWMWRSHGNGYVTARCTRNQSRFGDPSAESLKCANRRVASFEVDGERLFRYDSKTGNYVRQYRRNETPKQFERRALTCTRIESPLRLLWLVRLMVARRRVAPHSLEEFAADLRMHKVTASRGLKALVEMDLIKRFGGRGPGHKGKCRYMDTHDIADGQEDHEANAIEDRYGEHREDNEVNERKMRSRWRQIRCRKPPAPRSPTAHSDPILVRNELLASRNASSISGTDAELLADRRAPSIYRGIIPRKERKEVNNARTQRSREREACLNEWMRRNRQT